MGKVLSIILIVAMLISSIGVTTVSAETLNSNITNATKILPPNLTLALSSEFLDSNNTNHFELLAVICSGIAFFTVFICAAAFRTALIRTILAGTDLNHHASYLV